MEEVLINSDLVIRGNIICGDDGVIEANGAVLHCAGDKDAFDGVISTIGDRPRTTVTSDYDISGKIVKVSGHVVVRNGIIYNEAYSGHISANTSFQPINRREKDTAR